ncbi:exosortase [Bryobacterales bacterium F-183]|nr:exosortase [Bryobacterales bacterium F-183]
MQQMSGDTAAVAHVEARPTEKASSAVETPIPWTSILWFSAILLVSYVAIFKALVTQWSTDEDVGHGFFVPPIAAFIAWQKREEILGQPWVPNYLGILVVLWGSVQLIVGSLGAELFLQRTSFIIILAGAILLTGGWNVLKACGLPIFVLTFMVPLPKVIYGQLTLPLQLFASQVAENVLLLVGIPVLRDGNIIELATTKLSVVEACSGIRSLLSLSFIGIVYGYFFDDKPWMKWVLLAGTVPIAVAANAARVTATGIIADSDPALVQGTLHTMEGWVIFVLDLILLVALHTAINWIWTKRQGGAAAAA